MMGIVSGIMIESYELFGRMAPFLLFGYFFAGLIHVFLRTDRIFKHLGEDNFRSVLKAALFGAPLPLCSCGVIPAAITLKKEGASKGAVLSFLISTPTTGVDSIFATYSLLGPFFTVYRVAASLVTAVFSGFLANVFLKHNSGQESGDMNENVKKKTCEKCNGTQSEKYRRFFGTAKKVLRYAYIDLLRDSGPSLIFGILIGGVITYFIPGDLIESQLGYGIMPMLIMLAAGLPMYVCATSSIPIAASLMLKGMAPGAAFVFLLAGPATNIVTMSVVSKNMGKKALVIYLFSISVCGILMGGALNFLWESFFVQGDMFLPHHTEEFLPGWITSFSSLALFTLISRDIFFRFTDLVRKKL